jgi:N-acetylmuramoyl-L-alanine amidase
MFKNKRGISIGKILLIELILGLVVFAGISVFLYSLQDNTLFEKKVITRDLSLLSNTIQSVPGNVAYQYIPVEKEESIFDYLNILKEEKAYNYEFIKNKITISENFYSKISYPFFYNNYLEQGIYVIQNATMFTITNFNNAFTIHSKGMLGLKPGTSLSTITETPGYKITSTIEEIKLMAIDAAGGHYKEDIQNKKQGNGGIEHELSFDITTRLIQELTSSKKTVIQTRNQKEPKNDYTMEKRINLIPKETDLIISIGMNNQQNININSIYAYVPENNEQSSYFAKLMIDELLKIFPETKESKVLTTTQQQTPVLFANQNIENNAVSPKNLAVMLELGNLNIANNEFYKEESKSKIALAIKTAIEKYEASKTVINTGISCTSDGYKALVENSPKQTLIEEVSKVKGKTWIGKLEGNGNRDVAIVIPDGSDCGREFEIIYYFHGSHGYLLDEIVPECVTGKETCKSKSWFKDQNSDYYNKCPKDQGSKHDSGLIILKDVLKETIKLGKEQERNVILVYPFSGGPRGSGCTGTGYDSYWMYPARDESLTKLHSEVISKITELDTRAKIKFITIKGHSGGGVPLYRVSESNFKVNRIDFFDASYGSWAQKSYEAAMNLNPNVEFNIIVKPDTDTDIQGKSLKDKKNVNYIYTKIRHGDIPKEFFNMPSSKNNLLEPLIPNTLTSTTQDDDEVITKTRITPETCTYYDTKLIKKPYSKISGEEVHDSGCTLCREDQESITIAGQTIEVCWKYKELIEITLKKIVNSGFPIYDIRGFREGRTYNNNQDFGEHPYGVAIDINREYNGLYNDCKEWDPNECKLHIAGKKNPKREEDIEGTITKNSAPYTAMAQINWKWGGDWTSSQKDYMHFSISGK